jgi:hypothetical protein
VSVPSSHVDQATSKNVPHVVGMQSILSVGDGIFLDGKLDGSCTCCVAAAAVIDDADFIPLAGVKGGLQFRQPGRGPMPSGDMVAVP